MAFGSRALTRVVTRFPTRPFQLSKNLAPVSGITGRSSPFFVFGQPWLSAFAQIAEGPPNSRPFESPWRDCRPFSRSATFAPCPPGGGCGGSFEPHPDHRSLRASTPASSPGSPVGLGWGIYVFRTPSRFPPLASGAGSNVLQVRWTVKGQVVFPGFALRGNRPFHSDQILTDSGGASCRFPSVALTPAELPGRPESSPRDWSGKVSQGGGGCQQKNGFLFPVR